MVSDHVIEVGDDADRVFDVGSAHIGIGSNPLHATLTKSVTSVDQKIDRFKDRLSDDRFHHVELQLAGFGSHRYSLVISDDLEADLIDDLGNDGIDLRGHDR